MSTHLSRKRTLAISITACGAATGGLVFLEIVQHVLHCALCLRVQLGVGGILPIF
ncbi:hypothetical protein BDV36DRAFT_246156 [Aspergillus pseudocaelatus]|uniref:Disulfide bond formation protein B n=1 Tax=Aspergillus pseudocaelatus TaxID=1825620 RepID=A0ABQ6WYR0_9EURO|nr:hypothetical protein BDV36DRAFT_246156 [Aspergillus pseudocaelatus]